MSADSFDFTDIDFGGFGDFLDETWTSVSSWVDDFGTEYLGFAPTELNPFGDGWQEAGSFAGSSSWFDSNFAGDIVSGVPEGFLPVTDGFGEIVPNVFSIDYNFVSTDLGALGFTDVTSFSDFSFGSILDSAKDVVSSGYQTVSDFVGKLFTGAPGTDFSTATPGFNPGDTLTRVPEGFIPVTDGFGQPTNIFSIDYNAAVNTNLNDLGWTEISGIFVANEDILARQIEDFTTSFGDFFSPVTDFVGKLFTGGSGVSPTGDASIFGNLGSNPLVQTFVPTSSAVDPTAIAALRLASQLAGVNPNAVSSIIAAQNDPSLLNLINAAGSITQLPAGTLQLASAASVLGDPNATLTDAINVTGQLASAVSSGPAQLQAQIASATGAVLILEQELTRYAPGSLEFKQIQQQINQLNGQILNLDTQRAQALTVNNPPNPQVGTGTTALANTRVQNTSPSVPTLPGNYIASFDVETGLYNVEDLATGEIVARGLTQQQAILFADDANTVGVAGAREEERIRTEDRRTADLTAALNGEAQTKALLAQRQATLQNQQKQANQGDWRVKLRLAPGANYLYRANDGSGGQAGILQPLAVTDGVIFPYTPTITTQYQATYSSYDLTHSNYRGYFYQGSHVSEINLQAVFTAQDTTEANYLLAVIHFFRSATKMFYGNDVQRGAPPPLVFLQGLGDFQFNLHPCVISQFNYNLPADVDYIRAGSPNINGTNLLVRRDKQNLPTNIFSSAWERLRNAGVPKGGIREIPSAPTLGINSPTYVPTRMQIDLVLLPVQSRKQVSEQFSLQAFANGNLIKGGTNQPGAFW